jgi:ubiquinone/menaquinone biosynthesis C-methylase UbiE
MLKPGVAVFDENAEHYDQWFEEHDPIYQAELRALKRLMPDVENAIEIGVGTGRFAVPLGISVGVEPSANMAKIAARRGVTVTQAYGENLPFPDRTFDLALLVTVLCFVDDVSTVLREVGRILKPKGYILIGMIDPASPLGQSYETHKASSTFYREAHFHDVDEIIDLLKKFGFQDFEFCQTVFQSNPNTPEDPIIESGYGQGAFVVINGRRPK